MSNKKIIAIVGLMGAGKSTIGNRLAQKLKYYFIDSDQEIQDSENKSINEIFAKNGEKYFREIEVKKIKEIINRDEEMVLSLGGGAFINEQIRKLLKEKCLTIWLYASVEETLRRIGNKNNRPLLNQKNKREELENLIKKRYPIYKEADLHFDTTKLSHERILEKILKKTKSKN